MRGELMHSYIPADLFFKKSGSKYSSVELFHIKEYFRRFYRRFVRFSFLLDPSSPRSLKYSSKDDEILDMCALSELPNLYPDFILYGEFFRWVVFVRFLNPFEFADIYDAPLSLSRLEIRQFIAYLTLIRQKSQSGVIRGLLLSNLDIDLSYRQLLLRHDIYCVAITNRYVTHALGLVRVRNTVSEKLSEVQK